MRLILMVSLVLGFLLTLDFKGCAQEIGTWQQLPSANFSHKLVTSPYGILGAEFVDNYSFNPTNGVWLGKNVGENWYELGLEGQGVTDVFYYSGKIYATTYYHSDYGIGLFVSENAGLSWSNISRQYSGAKVLVAENIILFGTYSHGLWVSSDNGLNWEQKIGDGVNFGPTIESLSKFENGYLVDTAWGKYISYNNGQDWMTYTSLQNKLSALATNETTWLACSQSTQGMWLSQNSGESWTESPGWNVRQPCFDITAYGGRFYASGWGGGEGSDVYYTEDTGVTWHHTNLAPEAPYPITSLILYKGVEDYLIACGQTNGMSKYRLPESTVITPAFLSKLWVRNSMKEQTATITSYFDHAYPLLGYYLHQEPIQERSTTLNYLGQKAKEPLLYYSSHDGIDFGLKYGTPILAPASGYGTYSYNNLSGHQIKIDHQNYFQTIYMHLQDKELITRGSAQIWVNKGDKLGLVGMTGNTTGPHLHFAVVSDTNKNGSFADDNPQGRVDPYSWLDKNGKDPWEVYAWQDSVGSHQGRKSAYLWNDSIESTKIAINSLGGAATDDGLSVEIPAGALENEAILSLSVAAQIKARLIESTKILIKGTAYIIELTDPTGGLIHNISNVANLAFNLTGHEFENIYTNTLAFYYFDEALEAWQELESIWNETTKTLTAQTNHFSEFAIFAEKIDSLPPITSYELSGGQKESGWYIQHPVMDLMSYDPNIENNIDMIFYSLDGGGSWNEYANPFPVTRNGVYTILYRAQDKNENLEETKQTELLRINTSGSFFDESVYLDAIFTTANDFSL